MPRHEKKLTDKLDDEIKLAGLEALAPEDLEKHQIRNSDRPRTFEDACLEIVTYVEAKLGLRIRDSKPSETEVRGHSDPVDVGAVDSLASGNGAAQSSPRDGFFKCGGACFQRDLQCSRHSTQRHWHERQAEASHGPRVLAKERARKVNATLREGLFRVLRVES